ncbi:MAG: diaminopimelate epimerase [Oscillospiraceae bacterium]|nr:diaminopimelate epimerase [Oscillospiraceae bacterium]
MKFTKMQGIGNDYVYVNCFKEKVENPSEVSKIISDRHFGIGADGLILIMPSDKADFRMKMYNADGSEGMMCGNGTRCIGKYVYDNGLTQKKEITLETKSGIRYLSLDTVDGKVVSASVDMGKAVLKPSDIPVIADKDAESFIAVPVKVGNKEYKLTCISMGNPHAVVYMDNVDDLDLEKIGPDFENHKMFPHRVNTEFVEVISENKIKMRVWERGSGETLACGTGACASAAASVLNNYCKYDEEITVVLRGGELKITYQKDGTVYMRGPAVKVFDGEINI